MLPISSFMGSLALATRSSVLQVGRRRLRAEAGIAIPLARRRWLSDPPATGAPPFPAPSPGDAPTSQQSAVNEAGRANSSNNDTSVSGEQRNWTWSTPSPLRPGRGAGDIPIIPRVDLTMEEVVKALETQGATDVRSVDLRGKDTGMGDFMIFSTAATPLQMRRLANMIVQALKQRKLVNATGITGAEGIDCDDWMLVDCDNFIVHFMTAEARQELDLETHWATIASGTALGAKRQRGEEGHVEDPVDWNEDFGEQAALAAGRGVEKP